MFYTIINFTYYSLGVILCNDGFNVHVLLYVHFDYTNNLLHVHVQSDWST